MVGYIDLGYDMNIHFEDMAGHPEVQEMGNKVHVAAAAAGKPSQLFSR